MAQPEWDVVIVGAGVSGSLAANDLAHRGFKVVVLEAGPPFGFIDSHVGQFYSKDTKTPDAPWPGLAPSDRAQTEYAPRPTVIDMGDKSNFQDEKWYMLQTGAYPFNSTYERLAGGTSAHWLGTCLRHVPADFRLRSEYGNDGSPEGKELAEFGRDWPIDYDELEEWYLKAERVVGVAGDSAAYDGYLGADRSGPYPMDEIPLSYLDRTLGTRLDGAVVNGTKIKVMSTPQGRNSRDYPTREDSERTYTMKGGKTYSLFGEGRFLRYRCLGNTSCIPICPIQAKWDGTAALREATEDVATPAYPNYVPAEIRYRKVASKVVVGADGEIAEILYRDYAEGADPSVDQSIRGKIYVLAAHAIETPKLLLMSEWDDPEGKATTVANRSGKVGQHLMDHVIHLSWGIADTELHPFRGPLSTAGIGEFRDSDARRDRAAYRIEIGNDGWVWPAGAPQKTVWQIMNIDNQSGFPDGAEAGIDLIREYYARDTTPPKPKWYGAELRAAVGHITARQIRMAAEPEALPLPDSAVTLPCKPWNEANQNVDKLGLPKPQICYRVSEYTKKGFVEGADTLAKAFAKLGVKKIATTIIGLETAAAVFEYPQGSGHRFEYGGAGHIAGTYRMGDDPDDSVVDRDSRAHDHPNLFMLGSGTFPALGTANPTLTIMALALRAADTIADELGATAPPRPPIAE